jgi:hypothetical protein
MDSSCELPNPKPQAPNKLQIPNSNPEARRLFGFWALGFVWDLGFGTWDFF